MNALQQWMKLATPNEQERLASAASTSRAYLYHLAAGEEANYKRAPKLALAAAIETETQRMSAETAGRLPAVLRTDLVPGCAKCPFAIKCLGGVK